MKRFKTLLFATVIVVPFACKRAPEDRRKLIAKVDSFAELECRAITLREQRFELANKIRFTEDSLLKVKDVATKERLKTTLDQFNKDKKVIVKASLTTADTVQHKLQDILQNQLADQKERLAFNQLLNTTLKSMGCITKTE